MSLVMANRKRVRPRQAPSIVFRLDKMRCDEVNVATKRAESLLNQKKRISRQDAQRPSGAGERTTIRLVLGMMILTGLGLMPQASAAQTCDQTAFFPRPIPLGVSGGHSITS